MSGDPEADPDPESDAPPGPEEAPRQRPAAAGPPLLASALLRHELAPPHPHPLLGRIIALLAACGGAAAVVATFGTHGAGAGLVAAFAGLGALGLAPMPYGVRAAVLSLIASAGVAGTLWARSLSGAHDELLSATMVVFVTSALFFRAWHRGSVLARVLVAVGIALGVSWLGLRGVDDLSGVDIAWQTWVPHVLKLLLAVLLLLSLLAFMDSRSTGGCNAWATGILLWYAADVGIRWLVRSSPGYGMLQPWASLAYLVAPLLTAVLAVSIAQLLSVTQAGAEPA